MPTSELVPTSFPVAVNGVPYMLDDNPSAYEDRSIPTLRNVATGSTADETTLNPEAGFLRSFTSFERGAGQTHRGRADSDDRRFRDSWHVNPFAEEAAIKPSRLVETSSEVTVGGSVVPMRSAGNDLYMGDGSGDSVYRVQFGASASPTTTSRSTGGASIINQIEYNTAAAYLLATNIAGKVYYLPAAIGSATDRTPTNITQVTSLCMAHGVTVAEASHSTNGAGFYEFTGDPATAALGSTLVWANNKSGSAFVGAKRICRANGGFFYAPYGGEIHYITVDNSGTLAYGGLKATLGPEEEIAGLYEYLGFIFIALHGFNTGQIGLRMATQDTEGNLTIGALLDGFNPTGDMAFFGKHAYAALRVDAAGGHSRLESTGKATGYVTLDLTQINDGLAPAWAIVESFDGGSGQCWGIATGWDEAANEQWTYLASAAQLYRVRSPNLTGTNFDTDGWLSTGWVNWGIGDQKLLQEVAIDGESITAEYSLPADVDSYTAYTNGNEVSDVAIDLKFDIGATTAEMRTATARAFPQTQPARELILPLVLSDRVNDLLGTIHDRDARAERDTLAALEGTVIDVQEGQSSSFRALVTGHRFVGVHNQKAGAFAGTMVLTMKRLG